MKLNTIEALYLLGRIFSLDTKLGRLYTNYEDELPRGLQAKYQTVTDSAMKMNFLRTQVEITFDYSEAMEFLYQIIDCFEENSNLAMLIDAHNLHVELKELEAKINRKTNHE